MILTCIKFWNLASFDKSTNWIFVDNDEDDDEYEDSEKSKYTCT